MAGSSPLDLSGQAPRILELVEELASGISENDISPGDERRRRVASAWSALLLAIVDIGKSLPPNPSPWADWVREVGRVSRWFDGLIREHGLVPVLHFS